VRGATITALPENVTGNYNHVRISKSLWCHSCPFYRCHFNQTRLPALYSCWQVEKWLNVSSVDFRCFDDKSIELDNSKELDELVGACWVVHVDHQVSSL